MAHESKEWVYASKRVSKGQRGGIHVYIDADTLALALRNSNILINSKLMIKRYPFKGNKKRGKVLISIKECD